MRPNTVCEKSPQGEKSKRDEKDFSLKLLILKENVLILHEFCEVKNIIHIMAKKQQPKTEEPIALDVQLNKSEAFIEKNWKKIAIIIGAVIGHLDTGGIITRLGENFVCVFFRGLNSQTLCI